MDHARSVSWALFGVAVVSLAAALQFEQPLLCLLMLPFLAVEARDHFLIGHGRRWLLGVIGGTLLSPLLFVLIWAVIAFLTGLGDNLGLGHWGEFMVSAAFTPIATLSAVLLVARFEPLHPSRDEVVRGWLSAVVFATVCTAVAIALGAFV